MPLVAAEFLAERGFFAGNAVFFVGPFAEIDQLAAFAAERTPGLPLVPFHLGSTGRAVHIGAHIMQQVSLKGTSLAV